MTKASYNAAEKKALAYIQKEHPEFEVLSQKLNLGDNSGFNALMTDIFVNTSVETENKQVKCLLVDRFVSLLNQLAGGEVKDENAVT